MTTMQEQEVIVPDTRDPSLVDMAEMLAQIADKLLSAALVMAALSEKEVPKGSLIERLLQTQMPPIVTSGYQQTVTSGGTSNGTTVYPLAPIVQPPQQGKWRRNKPIPSTTISSPWTSGGSTGGMAPQWQSVSFNMAQFSKAVEDFVNQATGWTG